MEVPTRILIVEDLPTDARLSEREVRKALPDCEFQRVETREEYLRALAEFQPDVILSDFKLPRFDGLTAAEIARKRCPNVPFLIVTGSMNEDTAVECMKAGAWDYVVKEHIRRLGPAVLNALESRDARRQRQEAEEALRESEERFRRAVVHAPFPAILHTGDGRILLINDAWTAQSGYQLQEIPTLDVWTEKAYGDEKDRVLRAIRELHSLTESRDEGEFTIRTKSGDRRIWHFSSAPLGHLPDGDSLVMSMALDVTESRRNEEDRAKLAEQLRQAQRMESIGRLAGGIAHDFNNLLTVINGYSELILEPLDEGDPLWVHINEIRKAGERAAELTQQLLAFSRKQIIEPKPVALNAVVSSMARMIERLTGADVNFTTALAPDLPRIFADEGQLHQVLMNLVVNAKDAMPDGGSLSIATRGVEVQAPPPMEQQRPAPGAYVLLEVADTGIGMDAATVRLIFEPFYTTKGEGRGTGLGLSTVYGIVSQLGGWIQVDSAPGAGTRFQIFFPPIHGDTPAEPEQEPGLDELRGSETVLVVEDQEEVRALVTAVLMSHGYRVLEAADGSGALLLAERHDGPIHLMLTDMIMPRMSGAALAAQMRPLRPGMRVLYMSGFVGDSNPILATLNKSSEFLQKPFSPRALATKVRDVLGAGGTGQ